MDLLRYFIVALFAFLFNFTFDSESFDYKVFSDKFIDENQKKKVIVDSNLDLEDAISGLHIPDDIRKKLCIVNVYYFGYDSLVHRGQIITDDELKKEVTEIFNELFRKKFPINKIVPIVKYNWSDKLSMEDNNTSCFNYRNIQGTTKLSDHSYGRAVDINPLQNPYINYKTKNRSPENATYNKNHKGTIMKDSEIVLVFKKYGWKWGGDWRYTKDYQHFYKKQIH